MQTHQSGREAAHVNGSDLLPAAGLVPGALRWLWERRRKLGGTEEVTVRTEQDELAVCQGHLGDADEVPFVLFKSVRNQW